MTWILAFLWPTGDSRPERLYRSAVIASAGATLTYVASCTGMHDLGQWTPAVMLALVVATDGVRHAASKINEDGAFPPMDIHL